MANLANNARYTVLITIHGAQNLPIADMHNLSCDPFVEATIDAPATPRQPDEPPLLWRTPTVRHARDPTWDSHWVVSGVPASGFVLTMSVKDEDANDRDDRLGKAELSIGKDRMKEGGELRECAVKVQKRKGSVVPYIQTYIAALLPGQHLRKHNRIIVSVKVLGKAADQKDDRIYTVGPNTYTQHFSPLIGSMINRGDQFTKSQPMQVTGKAKRPASASTFVATKLQLTGPTPRELRHHYVGYNRFIVWIYSRSGIIGSLLYYGLRKQYRTIYSYNSRTRYGLVDAADEDADLRLDGEDKGHDDAKASSSVHSQNDKPPPLSASSSKPQEVRRAQEREHDEHATHESDTLASTFLSLTKCGKGGRVYTYVLTLDAEWRFSETGDEFAIDFLSKHMMHANGAQIVCYAGEFFVRRIPREDEGDGDGTEEVVEEGEEEDSKPEPQQYELIIDNNSGTYRPPKETLLALQAWFADRKRLGGLGRVTAMEAFDEKLKGMKTARKELKKRLAGGELPQRKQAIRHGSSASSVRIGGRKYSSGEVERIVAEERQGNTEEKRDVETTLNERAKGDSSGPQHEGVQHNEKSKVRATDSHDSGVHV